MKEVMTYAAKRFDVSGQAVQMSPRPTRVKRKAKKNYKGSD